MTTIREAFPSQYIATEDLQGRDVTLTISRIVFNETVRTEKGTDRRHVVYFKGRGIERELAVIPGLEDECVYCRECFDLCRGGLIVTQCDNAYAARLPR